MSRNKKSQSGKPYDSSHSFVKRMTRRVSEYIPNKLSSWFSSSNEDEAAVKDEQSRHQDPAQQQQQQHSPQMQVPPAKRQRTELNTPSWVAEPVPSTSSLPGPSTSASRAVHEAGPSGHQQNAKFSHKDLFPTSTPMHLNRYLVPTSSGLGITDEASNSSESTSGCSSLIPQENHMAEAPQDTSSKNTQRGSQLYSLLFDPNSVNPSNEVSKITPQPPAQSRRPNFDPSLIRSPSICSGNRIDVTKSPFYKGKTCYGGASAYRRSSGTFPSFLNTSLELMNSTGSLRSSLSARAPLNRHGANLSFSRIENNVSRSPQLSSLSQRILRAADAASPLSQSLAGREAGNLKRRIDTIYDYTPPQRQQHGPPTKSLNAPTVRDLLQNKVHNKVDIARSLTLPKSKPAWKDNVPTYSLRQEESLSAKRCNKIRRNQNDIIEDLPDVVDLPQISLPLTSLPSFDFAPKAPSSNAFSVAPSVNKSDLQVFTFSSPLAVELLPPRLTSTASPVTQTALSSPFQMKMVSPKPIPVKPATETIGKDAKDTKLDKKPLPAGSGFGDMFKKPEGSWECSECMVNNKAEAAKCISCNTPKVAPKKPSAPLPAATPAAPLPSTGFGSIFKKAEGSWDCSVCLVNNKSDVNKCVSCDSPKLATQSATSQSAQVVSKPFSMPLKPSGSWECPDCMCNNKPEALNCPACNAAKPGSSSTPSVAVNSFGDMFKKPADKWSCPVCKVDNGKDAPKCSSSSCSYENPNKPKAKASEENKPKYSFGMPSGNGTTPAFTAPKADDAKSLFTFGAPKDKDGNAAPSKGFVFGETKTSEEDKPKTFTFGMPAAKAAEEPPKVASPVKPAQTAAPTISVQFVNPPATTAPKLKRKADAEEPSGGFMFNQSSPAKLNSLPKENSPAAPQFAGLKFSLPKAAEEKKDAEPPAKKPGPSFNFLSEEDASTTPKKTENLSIFASKPSAFSQPSSTNTPLFGFPSQAEQAATKKNEPKPSGNPQMFQFSGPTKESAFGALAAKKTTFPISVTDSPKSFAFGTNDTTPVFGVKSPEPFGSKAPEPVAMFGAKEAPLLFNSKPSEGFGSKTTEIVPFGSKPLEAVPSITAFKPTGVPASPFGGSPATTTPATFGSFASSSPAPSASSDFGASNPLLFGQATTSVPVFGTPAAQTATPPSFGHPAPTFQMNQPVAPAGGFSFGANTGTPTATNNNMFAFGKDKPATPFGSNTLMAPKPAEPNLFGGQAAAPTPFATPSMGTPAFGSTQPAGGFNFSMNAPPAYPGAAQPQQANAGPVGGFQFNANQQVPQFNPEIRPSFNFTGSMGPTAFSATHTPSTPNPNAQMQARKIRKATRRFQPR
ncbi:nuclear pore complex protein Nup153 isoform X2 [Neocloeon triangulifer]|uniref:nuclear pore complex protein Nup153 isoform X2 n=1 Tax=Neocloeon triangulifer TaxID=2078957 RepID=UPI00286F8D55|nr:nuclear pore complex protein Nup153 isoform X2 [Neocloeon triangulifer]